MIADVGGIVTGSAESRNVRLIERVVEACDTGDVDTRIVEQVLAARHRSAIRSHVPEAADVSPSLVQVEDRRRERRALGIQSERVVDADEKSGQLLLQGNRTAGRAIGIEEFGLLVEQLRRKDAELEIDDLLLLSAGRRGGCLRVSERGVDCLLLKGRLATIPHDGAEKSQVRRRQGSTIN